MYNPWSGYRVTGTWEDHASYSEGGTDWPLPYGTALRAPASGRLVSNGWVGTAGRRATFYFDAPVRRVRPRSTTRMLGGYVEHDCDMVAFVFQHAKGYLGDAHFDQGALVGYSGASASGQDYGGDVHLHGHGQCIHGARVDFMKFVGSATAGGGYTPIEEEDMPLTPEDIQKVISGLLNYPAYDGGPSLSQAIKEIHSDASNVFHATFTGGPSMQDGGKPISQSLAEINGKPASGGGVIDTQVSDTDVAKIADATRAKFKAEPLA
jgi:hypothetical protein